MEGGRKRGRDREVESINRQSKFLIQQPQHLQRVVHYPNGPIVPHLSTSHVSIVSRKMSIAQPVKFVVDVDL